MKKIIICAMLLIIATATFSQQTNPSPTLTKQHYLQKSKNQKKAAWILVGGGTTLLLTGIIIPRGELTGFGIEDYKNDGIKGAFGMAGIVSMLSSIPLFIASSKNKKRAMNLSFKNESAMQIQKSKFAYRSVPSLTLKISL